MHWLKAYPKQLMMHGRDKTCMCTRQSVIAQQCLICREPTTLRELLAHLQKKNGVRIAVTEDDWATIPRTHVLVDRDTLLQDAIREAKKSRFDPTKVLDVRIMRSGWFEIYGCTEHCTCRSSF